MCRASFLRRFWLLGLLLGLVGCNRSAKLSLHGQLMPEIQQEIQILITNLDSLAATPSLYEAKAIFLKSRCHYKRIEPFVEYYFSGLSRRINGPALPEIEVEEHQVIDASGFQVLEELIYSQPTSAQDQEPVIRALQTDLRFVQNQLTAQPMAEHHVYEIIQHQLIRLATVGITGFDSPIAQLSLPEAEASLAGLRHWYDLFQSHQAVEWDTTRWNAAQKFLKEASDFSSFDRLQFIQYYLIPLSETLEIENKSILLISAETQSNKAFSGSLSDLMKGKYLNPDAFSPYLETQKTPQKVELGRVLFFDVNLSKSRTLSCATCHQPQRAFTDGLPVSTSRVHGPGVYRNTPTLLYAAFQRSLFYDMRSPDLENQIQEVFDNPSEFNLDASEMIRRLESRSDMKKLFKQAFPDKRSFGTFEIRNALAAYLRSLMPFQAKLDMYFQGKVDLTVTEKEGFNLFFGKAKCATCHFAPIYNGTQPPGFQITESEIVGVPAQIGPGRWVLDPDLGRFEQYKIDFFKHAFKTPTLRNTAITAPYMHNGIYQTLEEVVHFYNVGGGRGMKLDVPNQTLPSDSLHLSPAEVQAIVRFLQTLTDPLPKQINTKL